MRKLSLVERAFAYAKKEHEGQWRKDGTPYISHVLEVAARMATNGESEIVQTAALLHDIPEDKANRVPIHVSLAEIREKFGLEVADLVTWLTNDESLSHSEKKRDMIERFKRAPRDAKVIKLADRLHNVSSIVGTKWKDDRVERYVRETLDLVEVLRVGTESTMPDEIMAALKTLAIKYPTITKILNVS